MKITRISSSRSNEIEPTHAHEYIIDCICNINIRSFIKLF